MQPTQAKIDEYTDFFKARHADRPDWLARTRAMAEVDLYFFCKAILGFSRMTPTLHKELCEFLQRIPPRRKLTLLPRDHFKTSVARGLAIHTIIQPADNNSYIPDLDGCNTRLLFASETQDNAKNQIGWIKRQFENNQLLRALWPHRVWDDPRQQGAEWNSLSFTVPRNVDFPESTIETIGVGGAVTGKHFDILLKDDLITQRARNEESTMHKVIEWNDISVALFDDIQVDLEYYFGTRWAVFDLYSHLIETEPELDMMVRSIIEDGQPIFPERFPLHIIEQLRKKGDLFYLNYMNTAVGVGLTDFPEAKLRSFTIAGGKVVFSETADDTALELLSIGPENVDAPQPERRLPPSLLAFDVTTPEGRAAAIQRRESWTTQHESWRQQRETTGRFPIINVRVT